MARPVPTGFPESSSSTTMMADLRTPGPLTRDRILTAAVDSLAALTTAHLLSAVGTRAIARRAGVSTALVFHHFGSVDNLASAVLARVFDPGTVAVDAVNATIGAVIEAALPVDAAMAMHGNEFDRVHHDPELRVRLGVWALGGPAADDAYGRYLAEVDTRLEPLLAELLKGWGRELRPPWTPATYIAAHSSLLVGSVTRHLVDAHRSTRGSFARAAASMSMISMRVQGDRHSVDDRLSEINYYPFQEARLRRPITGESHRKRALVIQHAAEQFGIRGYHTTKMAQIARAAGVSESTLYAQFQSKAALAAELFDKQAADTMNAEAGKYSAGQNDRSFGAELELFLALLARFVATHTEIASPYVSVLADPLSDNGARVTSTMLAEVIDRHGAHGPSCLGSDMATLLVIGVVNRVLLRPATSPAEVARTVLAVFGISRTTPGTT